MILKIRRAGVLDVLISERPFTCFHQHGEDDGFCAPQSRLDFVGTRTRQCSPLRGR